MTFATARPYATDWGGGHVALERPSDRSAFDDPHQRIFRPHLCDDDAGYIRSLVDRPDYARMRLFKAPNDREPQLPTQADTVVPIASAHVVGKPLTDDHVHRVDRVARLTGRDPGATLRPVDVVPCSLARRVD